MSLRGHGFGNPSWTLGLSTNMTDTDIPVYYYRSEVYRVEGRPLSRGREMGDILDYRTLSDKRNHGSWIGIAQTVCSTLAKMLALRNPSLAISLVLDQA